MATTSEDVTAVAAGVKGRDGMYTKETLRAEREQTAAAADEFRSRLVAAANECRVTPEVASLLVVWLRLFERQQAETRAVAAACPNDTARLAFLTNEAEGIRAEARLLCELVESSPPSEEAKSGTLGQVNEILEALRLSGRDVRAWLAEQIRQRRAGGE